MATSSSAMGHTGHVTNGTGDADGDDTTQFKHFVQSCELYTLRLQYTMVWYMNDQGLLA